jgi:hypothetical protein
MNDGLGGIEFRNHFEDEIAACTFAIISTGYNITANEAETNETTA